MSLLEAAKFALFEGADTVETQTIFSLFETFLPLTFSRHNQSVCSDGLIIGSLWKDDVLSGDDNNDLILGLWGDDSLFGKGGDDSLWGGFGNDLLDGGMGNNVISGGWGRDQFVLNADGSFDLILDYKSGFDTFLLQDGLTFSQLAITQVGNDTQIRYLGQSDAAVLLKNTEASSLSQDDFLSTSLVPTFDSLVIFGDSLSDTGNIFDLTGFFPPPPYFEGRFSNGPIWSDYFSDDLGLGADQVFNFAHGGAMTGDGNGLEPFLENPTGQDWNFPGLQGEVDQYIESLGGGAADSNGLYFIWIGPNDLFNLPSDPAEIGAFLTQSVQNIATSITTLAARGAQTFLVPNLPDLGLTPRSIEGGVSAQATELSAFFNAGLADALDALENSPILDIDIVPVDIFSATQDILGSPEAFGYTNVTDQLLLQADAPTDARFFWWDDTHPTTVAHSLLADVFQSTLFQAGYLLNEEVSDPLLNPSQADTIARNIDPQALLDQEPTYALGAHSPQSESLEPDLGGTLASPAGWQASLQFTTSFETTV